MAPAPTGLKGRRCPVTGHALPPDRYVSRAAAGRLVAELADLPDLRDALVGALCRQLRFTTPNGSRPAERPLPVNLAAGDAAYVLRTTLVSWAAWAAARRGEVFAHTWTGVRTYLAGVADWLGTLEGGPAAYDELFYALAQARRAVDRPADRVYVGTCHEPLHRPGELTPHAVCDGELYADPARQSVTCPRCRAEHDVPARRAWLLEQAWDVTAPGPVICRALAGAAFGGLAVSYSTLRRWVAEGKVPRRGYDRGQGLYRLGDVVTAATERR